MAATWCALMGSRDDFGQDMRRHTRTLTHTYTHTLIHTDGNPQSVARRWRCWLLICSDQWFPTWSFDNRGTAPTELALQLGTPDTHCCSYARDKSARSLWFQSNEYELLLPEFKPLLMLKILIETLCLVQNNDSKVKSMNECFLNERLQIYMYRFHVHACMWCYVMLCYIVCVNDKNVYIHTYIHV